MLPFPTRFPLSEQNPPHPTPCRPRQWISSFSLPQWAGQERGRGSWKRTVPKAPRARECASPGGGSPAAQALSPQHCLCGPHCLPLTLAWGGVSVTGSFGVSLGLALSWHHMEAKGVPGEGSRGLEPHGLSCNGGGCGAGCWAQRSELPWWVEEFLP